MTEPVSPLLEPPAEKSRSRHEERDVNARGILLAAGLLVVVGLAVQVAAWGLFDYLGERVREEQPPPLSLVPRLEPGNERKEEPSQMLPRPRLEGIDPLEFKRRASGSAMLYTQEHQQLETYGWVNKQEGIVRMPIREAMRMIVEHQLLPSEPAAPARPAPNQRRPRPSSANSGR